MPSSVALGGDFWNTDGFVIAPQGSGWARRSTAATTNRALSGKATWDASSALQLWAAGGVFTGGDRPIFTEDYQKFGEGRGGARWLAPSGGVFTAALFGNRRASEGNSYTIDAARATETPQRHSSSPAHSTGMSLQWTQMAGEHHQLSTGLDVSSAAARSPRSSPT